LLEGEDAPWRSPIVLVGPPGCGKTHLAFGLTALCRARFGARGAQYIPAIDFARELADAIDTHAVADLRARYCALRFLAVDDLAPLAEKAAAQRELLTVLDAMEGSGALVLVTCHSPPQAAPGLHPALLSRLEGGLTVPIEPPGAMVRDAFLSHAAELRGTPLPDDARSLLVKRVSGGMPELLGALAWLETAARDGGQRVSLRLAETFFRRPDAPPKPTLRDIAVATAKHFAVRLSDMRSPSRRRSVVTARDVAVYLARRLTGQSFQQIGSFFAGRDHSTISHGCSKTEELLRSDASIREAVARLSRRFGAEGG